MVVMGGMSEEREVSLATGRQVVENLDKEQYEVLPVVISQDGKKWEIKSMEEIKALGFIGREVKESKLMTRKGHELTIPNKEMDVVFIALHGRYGEDGRLQGLLDWLGIRYTGSGVLASSIGMDKLVFRQLMEINGVPVAKIVDRAPCVVKPVGEGSSVGVSLVKKDNELEKAVSVARRYGDRVLIEEYIKGVEVSCGVLGNNGPVALPVIEIVPKNNFFDYEAKYTKGMSQEICPARIDNELAARVQELAIKVFRIVGCKGYARVDMIIRGEEILVLEINTLPGLTVNSLLPKEAKVAGMDYSKLLDKIIKLALEK